MIVRAQEALPVQSTGGSTARAQGVSKLGIVVRLSGRSSTGQRRIDIQVAELMNRLRSDISHGSEKAAREPPLYD